MMIRNWLIFLARWIIAWGTFAIILAIILVSWVFGYRGYRKYLSRWYRPVLWLDGQCIVKCKKCDFSIRWCWNFCPGCGDAVQETLVEEMERKTFAQQLNHMFKVKFKP